MDKISNLLVRKAILLQLEAASPASLPIETIVMGLEMSGFTADFSLVEKVIDYLAQKDFVILVRSQICAAHVRAKLTAKGRDYLESGDV